MLNQYNLLEARMLWQHFYAKYAAHEKRLCEKIDLNVLLKPVDSEKLDILEAALEKADWDNSIFDETDLPHYVLSLHIAGRVSFQQFVTVMERWQTFTDFPHLQTYKILNERGEFTEEARGILLKAQEGLRYLKDLDGSQLEALKYLISALPQSEQIFYTTGLGKIEKNQLNLANPLISHNVILITEDKKILHVSAGVYDALGLVRFGFNEYVRPLHRLGMATIDNIEEGIRGKTFVSHFKMPVVDAKKWLSEDDEEKLSEDDEKWLSEDDEEISMVDDNEKILIYCVVRITSLHFPGTKPYENLHDYPDSAVTGFEATSHDKYHAYILSAIPKILLVVLGYCVDIMRGYTGMTWSKEIWTLIDCEMVYPITLLKTHDLTKFSNKNLTQLFCEMIEMGGGAVKYCGFILNNRVNVNFIALLLDMHNNPDIWQKLSIETKYLSNLFKICYEIVGEIFPLIKKDPSKIQLLKLIIFFDFLKLEKLLASAAIPGQKMENCASIPKEYLSEAYQQFAVIENIININISVFLPIIAFKKAARKRFDLLLLADIPNSQEYQALPGSSSMAYALIGNDLYHINKVDKTCLPLFISLDKITIIKDRFFPSKVFLINDGTSQDVCEKLSAKDIYLRSFIPDLVSEEIEANTIGFIFFKKILVKDIIIEILSLDYLNKYPDCSAEACTAYMKAIMDDRCSLEESEEYASSFLSEAYKLQLPSKRANSLWQLFYERYKAQEQRICEHIEPSLLSVSVDSLDILDGALKEADWDNVIFNDADLCQYALSLYRSERITFQQLATLMERWQTFSEFTHLKTYEILNEWGEFNEEAINILLKALQELHYPKYLDELQLEQLRNLIAILPLSEQVFYITSLGNFSKKEGALGLGENDELIHMSVGVYDAIGLVRFGLDNYIRPMHRFAIKNIDDIVAGTREYDGGTGITTLCKPGTLQSKPNLQSERKMPNSEQNVIAEYRSLGARLFSHPIFYELEEKADQVVEMAERLQCDDERLYDFIKAIRSLDEHFQWWQAEDLFREELYAKWMELSQVKDEIKKLKENVAQDEMSTQLSVFFTEYNIIYKTFMNGIMNRQLNLEQESPSSRYKRYRTLLNEVINKLPISKKKTLLIELLEITNAIFKKDNSELLLYCNELLKGICFYERHYREQDWPIAMWQIILKTMNATLSSEETLNDVFSRIPDLKMVKICKKLTQVLMPLYNILCREIENIIQQLTEENLYSVIQSDLYENFSAKVKEVMEQKFKNAVKNSESVTETEACKTIGNRYRLCLSAGESTVDIGAEKKQHSNKNESQKEKESPTHTHRLGK